MQSYQLCNRCVMDTTDPEISFDEHGNCNHCNDSIRYIKNEMPSSQEKSEMIQEMLTKIKSRKSRYDCVIGISGGVDSAYLAITAKKEWGLNPLVVHMDNGWNSEQSVINVANICETLEIDYECTVLDWSEFRELQLAVLRSSIVEVDMPTDIAISSILHKTAAKYNIKYIFLGGNFATEGILPKKWFYDPKDKKLLSAIFMKFFNKRIKKTPCFDFKQEIYYKLFRGIRIKYPLNLISYNKTEIMEMLINEFNYVPYGSKHHENYFTKFCQGYLQPKKFSLDYRRATFSSLICNNLMKREDALLELKNPPWDSFDLEKTLNFVASKLDLNRFELDEIVNAPPSSYKNYPNNEKFLRFLYSIYMVYFKKLLK